MESGTSIGLLDRRSLGLGRLRVVRHVAIIVSLVVRIGLPATLVAAGLFVPARMILAPRSLIV